jgi:hypothetical protein
MVEKGFPPNWIKQMMSTMQGGKVCNNVNGIRTPFFNIYQSLGQGDPLSPMMFNLVAEVLATLMRKATTQGKVMGVVSHLIPEDHTYTIC